MYNDSNNYGIVLISGKEYRCYVISICNSYKEFKLISSDTEHLQKKQKKGGQSAARFSRTRVEKYNWYITKICDIIIQAYMKNNHTKCIIEGLILAGPSLEKNDVLNNELIQKYFSDKILSVIPTPEITDETVYNVYERCYDYIASDIDKYEFDICKDINNLVTIASDKLLFGDDAIQGIRDFTIQKIIYFSDLKDEFKKEILDKKYDYELIEIKNLSAQQKLPANLIGIKFY